MAAVVIELIIELAVCLFLSKGCGQKPKGCGLRVCSFFIVVLIGLQTTHWVLFTGSLTKTLADVTLSQVVLTTF